MRKLVLVAAALAAVVLAIPASTNSASAQGVAVGVGPGGVGVRVGEPGYRGDGWRHRRAYGYGHCRTVREKIVTPRGRVIYKSQRICG